MILIKLIWDFRGADAEQTAAHHSRHLLEYAKKNELLPGNSNHERVTDEHFIAWLTVLPEDMIATRDTLKPHRGQQIG
jgi:desulfoferrodoxin (superoxide reductase-like protein)